MRLPDSSQEEGEPKINDLMCGVTPYMLKVLTMPESQGGHGMTLQYLATCTLDQIFFYIGEAKYFRKDNSGKRVVSYGFGQVAEFGDKEGRVTGYENGKLVSKEIFTGKSFAQMAKEKHEREQEKNRKREERRKKEAERAERDRVRRHRKERRRKTKESRKPDR